MLVENKFSFATATWPRKSKAVRHIQQHRVTHGINNNQKTWNKIINNTVENCLCTACANEVG